MVSTPSYDFVGQGSAPNSHSSPSFLLGLSTNAFLPPFRVGRWIHLVLVDKWVPWKSWESKLWSLGCHTGPASLINVFVTITTLRTSETEMRVDATLTSGYALSCAFPLSGGQVKQVGCMKMKLSSSLQRKSWKWWDAVSRFKSPVVPRDVRPETKMRKTDARKEE